MWLVYGMVAPISLNMIKQILICLLFLNLEKVSAAPLSYLGAGSSNISVRTNGINNWTIDAPTGWSIVAGTNVVLITNTATKTITVSASSSGSGDSFWNTNAIAVNAISNKYPSQVWINGNLYTEGFVCTVDFDSEAPATFNNSALFNGAVDFFGPIGINSDLTTHNISAVGYAISTDSVTLTGILNFGGGNIDASGNITATSIATSGDANITGNIYSSIDLESTTIGSGFICKSPNGTRWRITVANDGSIVTTGL